MNLDNYRLSKLDPRMTYERNLLEAYGHGLLVTLAKDAEI